MRLCGPSTELYDPGQYGAIWSCYGAIRSRAVRNYIVPLWGHTVLGALWSPYGAIQSRAVWGCVGPVWSHMAQSVQSHAVPGSTGLCVPRMEPYVPGQYGNLWSPYRAIWSWAVRNHAVLGCMELCGPHMEPYHPRQYGAIWSWAVWGSVVPIRSHTTPGSMEPYGPGQYGALWSPYRARRSWAVWSHTVPGNMEQYGAIWSPHGAIHPGAVRGHMARRSTAPAALVPVPPACPAGTFGPRCAQLCRCPHNASCHPASGTCPCTPGRIGHHCDAGEWAPSWEAPLGPCRTLSTPCPPPTPQRPPSSPTPSCRPRQQPTAPWGWCSAWWPSQRCWWQWWPWPSATVTGIRGRRAGTWPWATQPDRRTPLTTWCQVSAATWPRPHPW